MGKRPRKRRAIRRAFCSHIRGGRSEDRPRRYIRRLREGPRSRRAAGVGEVGRVEMARLTNYEATVAQMATTERFHSSTSLLVALTTQLSPDPRKGPSTSMSTESLLPGSMM